MSIEKFQKFANKLDWAGSIACIGYGIYISGMWWILGGIIGLVIAYFNPSKKVSDKITSKFKSKATANVSVASQDNVLNSTEHVPAKSSKPPVTVNPYKFY